MANREASVIEITPEVLLKAYACGIFPMAESADDPALYWIEPEERGIIPLDRFHVPARLARTVRSDQFTVTVNRDFDGVLDGCAESQPGRPRTWINSRIRTLYRKLYDRRHCHSVEVYDDKTLVGGLYGVTLGRAFFGESMFHRTRDASKVALVHLMARLKAGGFKLSTRNSSPTISRPSARSRCRSGSITSSWKPRSAAMAISRARHQAPGHRAPRRWRNSR